MADMPLQETGICSLCGGPYEHFGNNPEPLKDFEERCCDDCNWQKVVPARLGRPEGSMGERNPVDADTERKTAAIQAAFGSVDEAHRHE